MKKVVDGFLEAFLFGETDPDHYAQTGKAEHFDQLGFGINDVDTESREEVRALCYDFRGACMEHGLRLDYDPAQFGRDFYFTLAGHGVGYWDREDVYGEDADPLTRLVEERYGTAGASLYGFVDEHNQVVLDGLPEAKEAA